MTYYFYDNDKFIGEYNLVNDNEATDLAMSIENAICASGKKSANINYRREEPNNGKTKTTS